MGSSPRFQGFAEHDGFLVAVLLVGSLTAAASSAAASVRSLTAVGPGGVCLHAWVSAGRRGAATLIVINGGPGFSHVAAPPAGVLAPQFRTVFYDQRGTGLSHTPSDRAFDLPHQVGDLEALRRRLGTQRIDLLGHSWGGLIAAAYAAEHPRRVGALVLADAEPADGAAAARGTTLLAQRIGALLASGVIPSPLPPVVGDDCSALLNAYTPAYLANPKLHVPGLPRGACSQATSTQTNAAQTPAIRTTVLAGLRRYRGRALIIFGSDDPFRPAFQPADLAEMPAAHVQLKVLPYAGHLAWAESRHFFPIIRHFLST
jgi:pimeloyl-ACP methyl ester carboxylesterase